MIPRRFCSLSLENGTGVVRKVCIDLIDKDIHEQYTLLLLLMGALNDLGMVLISFIRVRHSSALILHSIS